MLLVLTLYLCIAFLACGIGCQYGSCKHIVPWIEGNDPSGKTPLPLPEFPEYASGLCMKAVYNNFAMATGDQHPVCRAKEVHSLTATLSGTNPTYCNAGEMITVSVMAGFTSNSAVGRQDIALYTAQDAMCHGATPSANDRNCARDGGKCGVHVLGQYDKQYLEDSRIKFKVDKDGYADSCADLDEKGTFVFAPRSLEIPCVGKYENGAWTDKVVLQACLSWRQPGGDIDCDEVSVCISQLSAISVCVFFNISCFHVFIAVWCIPGHYLQVVSKRVHECILHVQYTNMNCFDFCRSTCEYIPLNITIRTPIVEIISTPAPTTQQPSKKPSAQPTDAPSKRPSAPPTSQPSKKPSAQPTDAPSRKPTTQPTSQPSKRPTTQPTSQPTSKPTAQPTSQPSKKPTTKPTSKPTTKPTSSPTNKPTASAELGNRV